MELANVILGPVVTEKAERLKAAAKHSYTLIVAPEATKIDVKKAIERFYDVEVEHVRVIKVWAKTRSLPTGGQMEKRHAAKKVIVTLAPKSKQLDLASFLTQS
ncbi:MAG: 50S ribosomal protein L23 [Candidatus Peribacteraceae bacterium]|jgi:large subunit ribosomal protein L23